MNDCASNIHTTGSCVLPGEFVGVMKTSLDLT